MNRIVEIKVLRMYESCQRTTYLVELTTDEGFTMTPEAFATGSLYTKFEGLSKKEARDRALTSAHDWADFLRLDVTPFVEDGITYEPEMKLETYTMRREEED